MNHILYLIFKIVVSISSKKFETVTRNPPKRIYVNKIEDRVIFESKTGYYLEVLTPEAMKLLGSTNNENGGNVPHLEITEVVLVHCNIVNNDYQHNSRVSYAVVPNKSLGQLLNIPPKNFIFSKIFNSDCSYIKIRSTDQYLNCQRQ